MPLGLSRFLLRYFVPFILTSALSVSAYAELPPRHEANRLLIAVEEAVVHQNWSRADELLERMETLQITLPVDYYYFSGQVHFELKNWAQARRQLEEYVVRTDGNGQHYQAALRLITEVEQVRNQSGSTSESASLAANTPDSTEQLQALYLADEAQDALLLHLNALLTTHAYHGSRLRRQAQNSGIEYLIGVDRDSLTVTEKRFDPLGQMSLKVDRLGVFGVNPLLRYDCDYDRFQCWIYHPQNSYQIWLMLDRNETGVKEIASTIGKLLKVLQKGSDG